MAIGKTCAVDDLRIESAEGEGQENGGARAFAVTARPIEGTPRVLVAFEDVTEAERAASAARRVELGFREVLGEASEAIFMVGEAGQVLFANRAAATTFGYEREELVGLRVEVLLPEREREAYDAYRADYQRAPSPSVVSRRELLARRKDGSEVPVELTLDSMTGEAGRIFVAFVSDITQRREDEQKIREYQDRLERMAFDAALSEERERRRIAVDLHDRIGQSLALAQIKLTSAREALSGPPRADVGAVIALLEQSAVETRTLTFELSPPVLYDLGLKEALSWLADEVEKRYGIRVDVVDDDLEKPLDDTTRALVFRAVRELLMNVFKHAKVEKARVSLRRSDDHFDITVEDSGVGFEKDAGAERTAGGFGLFSVREQIRRLGGTLEIDSAADRGTRVTMLLPLAPPSGRSAQEGASS
jgi:PAS domain S-box-containing protein